MNIHKIKPHIRNKRFYNHEYENPQGFLGHTVYMLFKERLLQKKACPTKIASWVDKTSRVTSHTPTQPLITWIGHSTFLIQCAGINILTDPIFGDASWFYKRILPVGLLPHELPPIDVVVLSHNHRDHMDAQSLHALQHHKPHILVPEGDKAWFTQRNFSLAQEFMWWEQTTLSFEHAQQRARCTFLPAMHWSQRGFFDKNRSLWGSWMIEVDGTCIYFAGDTSYSSHFSAIAREFPVIHIAMMPIGPCEPRAWMETAHLSARQAGQAFLDLNAHHFIPMHWGTFPFGIDYFDAPLEYLTTWWDEYLHLLARKKLHIPKIGYSLPITW
jgi:L-ascorbate metabolism protein UlaG (beta-lactamase superfamily)